MTILMCNTYQTQQTAIFQIVAGSDFNIYYEPNAAIVNLDGYNIRTGNGNQNGGSITPSDTFFGRTVETIAMNDAAGPSEYFLLRLGGGPAAMDLFSSIQVSGDFSIGPVAVKYYTGSTSVFDSTAAAWVFNTYNIGVFVPGNTYTIELGVD